MNEKEQREWIYNNYSHQAELVAGETFPNGDEMVIVSNNITEQNFYILFPACGEPHEISYEEYMSKFTVLLIESIS